MYCYYLVVLQVFLQRYFQYRLTFQKKSVVFCHFDQKVGKCGWTTYCGCRITTSQWVFSSSCLRYTDVCPLTTIPVNNTTSVMESTFYILSFSPSMKWDPLSKVTTRTLQRDTVSPLNQWWGCSHEVGFPPVFPSVPNHIKRWLWYLLHRWFMKMPWRQGTSGLRVWELGKTVCDIELPLTFKTLILSEVTHEAALLKERKVGNNGFHLGERRVIMHLRSF